MKGGGTLDTLTREARCSSQAFTVIELTAVLAMLALLATVAIAGSRMSGKTMAKSIVCENNLKQLGLAWSIYAVDHLGQLPPNKDTGSAGKSKVDASWTGGWLDFNSGNTDCTNVALLVDHNRYPFGAYLGTYLTRASLFKCPADASTIFMAGERAPRVRTVAMNRFVGKWATPWISQESQQYRLYENVEDLVVPSRVFVILDEREDSINSPAFATSPGSQSLLVDFPASYHAGAGNFVFADGHTEARHWVDPRTMPPIAPSVLLPLNVSQPANPDIAWLNQHATEPR
jgi:prepilin-type processing-associated H-X9-DG protein